VPTLRQRERKEPAAETRTKAFGTTIFSNSEADLSGNRNTSFSDKPAFQVLREVDMEILARVFEDWILGSTRGRPTPDTVP
jgi:hypothetical protein